MAKKAKLRLNLAPELQRLDIVVKGLVNTQFMGNYASAFKGTGLEFSEFRNYTPNDDASRIDWKTSNRARTLLVKEFIEERNLNVFFIVDVSSRMLLSSVNKLKAEYVAELVASFSHTILKEGDYVGLTLFSDDVVKRIIPSNGMRHFYIISDALSNINFYGGGFNLKKALEHAIKFFPRDSLVIVISDFINEENFSEELKLAAHKFDLIGMMVRDPIDTALPGGMGQVLVEDPVTGERLLIAPNKMKYLYEAIVKKEISSLSKSFRDAGAELLPLSTNKSFVEDLVMFFKRRKLKWR